MIEFIIAHLYMIGVLIAAFLFAIDRAITYEERKEKRLALQKNMTKKEKSIDDSNESFAIIIVILLSWLSVFYMLGDMLGEYIIKRKGTKNDKNT